MPRLSTTSLVAAAAATAVLAVAGVARATTTSTDHASTTTRPCGMKDVSFYFGGESAGMGQRTFDVTLVDQSGVPCTLKDTPAITLGVPKGQKKVPVTIDGRGGTLVLRPDAPLHSTLSYLAPDTASDGLDVDGLTLAMPDGTSTTTFFDLPGDTAVYARDGVTITAWTTGFGLGQGQQSF